MTQTQTIPTLSVGIDDAARAIGVARCSMYDIVARGEVASFKLGRRRMILMSELTAYINRMAKENAR